MSALPVIAFAGLVLIIYFAVRRQWRALLVVDCVTLAVASVVLGSLGLALYWAALGLCCWKVEIGPRT